MIQKLGVGECSHVKEATAPFEHSNKWEYYIILKVFLFYCSIKSKKEVGHPLYLFQINSYNHASANFPKQNKLWSNSVVLI